MYKALQWEYRESVSLTSKAESKFEIREIAVYGNLANITTEFSFIYRIKCLLVVISCCNAAAFFFHIPFQCLLKK